MSDAEFVESIRQSVMFWRRDTLYVSVSFLVLLVVVVFGLPQVAVLLANAFANAFANNAPRLGFGIGLFIGMFGGAMIGGIGMLQRLGFGRTERLLIQYYDAVRRASDNHGSIKSHHADP